MPTLLHNNDKTYASTADCCIKTYNLMRQSRPDASDAKSQCIATGTMHGIKNSDAADPVCGIKSQILVRHYQTAA